MLKTIIDKEAREILGSTRFVIAFIVCVVLILMTFYTGAKNYEILQARYEAAKAENLRQMEGLTDWFSLRQHRIFLPPNPLTALVSGVSNDIGRTIGVEGRGELTSTGSRFSEEPIFAVFRFLDLEFLFTVILSLFAILLGYDAICGEKEQGTLRLSFANSVPRDKYILGKLIGSFMSLAIPLIIALALGCLFLPLMGVTLSSTDWIRLILVIATGLLYFGAFLTLSVFISSLTEKSSGSFMIILVVWILAVLIIPRASVLVAARAVEVPSIDQISFQKARYSSELWQEDRENMSSFKPTSEDMQEMMNQFNRLMDSLATERENKMTEFGGRLNEERFNAQSHQQKLAFSLARISPAASLSLAVSGLAGTSLDLKNHFVEEATNYRTTYADFIKEKTGMNPGGRVMMFSMNSDEDDPPEQIDPTELPVFSYNSIPFSQCLSKAVIDMGILAIYNIVFFLGAFFAFRRYDVR